MSAQLDYSSVEEVQPYIYKDDDTIDVYFYSSITDTSVFNLPSPYCNYNTLPTPYYFSDSFERCDSNSDDSDRSITRLGRDEMTYHIPSQQPVPIGSANSTLPSLLLGQTKYLIPWSFEISKGFGPLPKLLHLSSDLKRICFCQPDQAQS